jgi:hypothetical protein
MLNRVIFLPVLLHKDGSVSVRSVRAVEMIGYWVGNFEMRSADFRSHATNERNTCEETFPSMKQNKSKFRSRITDVHLHDVMRTEIS